MTARAQGMVVTSHPDAVVAGLRTLDAGGSAADAAIAAAAVLCVVDPRMTGVGGDLFAIFQEPGEIPTGIEAAGWSAQAFTPQALAKRGIVTMPDDGALTVTVPGAVSGWDKLHRRHGRLPYSELFTQAITSAHRGYFVERAVEREWKTGLEKLQRSSLGSLFLRDGEPPEYGAFMKNPSLGTVLEGIAADRGRDFYQGKLARQIASAIAAENGLLGIEDLAEWPGARWVDPIATNYRGHDIYEMPPPGQGLVVLEALAILNKLPFNPATKDVMAVGAVAQAVVDGAREIGDPQWSGNGATALLLDEEFVSTRANEISRGVLRAETDPPASSDTVYVTVVDPQGRVCSLIQSIYQAFGSGVVVPEGGFVLQNRGANFTLESGHPNQAGPRKRPYHTIIPSMMLKDGGFFASFGVVGGFMQTQGQVQIVQKLVDEHHTAQDAVDQPRWRWLGPRRVAVEEGFDSVRVDALEFAGYAVEALSIDEAGGSQLIVQRDSQLEGGSDWRKDGLVGVL